MRIESIEAFPIFLDPTGSEHHEQTPTTQDHGYVIYEPWATLYSPGYEGLFVKIVADGVVGWGEALTPVAPHVAANIVERLLKPLLIGQDATQVPVLWRRMSESMRARGHLTGHHADAMAAVDIALWDLRGHAEGRPVADLLGGCFRQVVPSYVSGIRAADVSERIDLTQSFVDRGFRMIKLHLGHGVSEDLTDFDVVQSAAPSARVGVDAHWIYSLGEAKALAHGLDERGAWFLEAPLAPEDVEGHRDLAAAAITPIAVGESLRSRFEFVTWLQRRALQIAQPDIGRTGITEGMAIAGLTEAFHGTVAPHHSVALGVALAAGVHMAAATPNLLAFEYQPHTMAVASRVLDSPFPVLENGDYPVTDAPGLGVDVNEATIRRLVAA